MVGVVSRNVTLSTGVLVLLCTALGGLVAAEWYGRQNLAEGSIAPLADKNSALPKSANSVMPALSTWGEVLTRPLFSPNRRPADKAPVASADPRSMRLIAIVIPSHHNPHALIRHGSPSELDRVVEGGMIENWTVDAIKSDRVILHDSDGTLVLMPVDGPALPPANPPNHPPTPASAPPQVAPPPRPTPPLPQRAG
jgi:hypothetical protein